MESDAKTRVCLCPFCKEQMRQKPMVFSFKWKCDKCESIYIEQKPDSYVDEMKPVLEFRLSRSAPGRGGYQFRTGEVYIGETLVLIDPDLSLEDIDSEKVESWLNLALFS
jgi:hypothetical protein